MLQALKWWAERDQLTALPNRFLLSELFNQAIAVAQRYFGTLAVGVLYIDGFKRVNDRYGHAAGDRLRVMVADRLEEIIRSEDSVARVGGDGFVLRKVIFLPRPCQQNTYPIG